MRPPAFLIVGTPRSGTTLVHRLASELEGVGLGPETHFFTDFATVARKRWPPPLEGAALREALAAYSERRYLREVPFEVDAVVSDLGGRCGSLLDLYGAIVHHLTGDAAIVGEKTPGHLLWWRPLTTALPSLKLVAVVRDPRAVVASWIEIGWTDHLARPAQRWSADERRVVEASRALGPDRLLVLTYEQVVSDPDTARAQLARFLGLPGPPLNVGSRPDGRALSWERWKAIADQPIDPRRAVRWHELLSDRQRDDVRAICRSGMLRRGYDDVPSRLDALRRRLTFGPGTQRRRLRLGARRIWREAQISRIGRGLTQPGAPPGRRRRPHR